MDFDLSPLATIILGCLAVGCLVVALVYPMLNGDARASKRRKELASPVTRKATSGDGQARQKRNQVLQSLKEIEKREKTRQTYSLDAQIAQAGLGIDKSKFYMFSLASAAGVGVLGLILSGQIVGIAVGAIVGGFGLPRWYLARARKKRLGRFANEFPNALDVITRGIKAGLPLNDCVRIIASEAAEPVKSEFRQVTEGLTLGITLPEAAEKLYERVPTVETNFFGIVLNIQQKTGGNLAETLANLSKVIRERRKMRDKIAAVSMEAKASAGIIACLPPAVCLMVYLTTPKYMSLLWTTSAGKFALLGSAIWMMIGVAIMRKMINFDI